ncbi:MAG: UMP kinase [Bacteroidales bacterium]|nr:UMP kinase [Bacteroidales bacterium]
MKRILLKLSGESLGSKPQTGIDSHKLLTFVENIKDALGLNVEVGIVLGGGNFMRGNMAETAGIDKTTGDYMGMLATMMNSLALYDVLHKMGIPSTLTSALPIDGIFEKFYFKKAIEDLKQKKVVIMAAGTGNPFFTTDTAAALRAIEIKADVLIKGTRVDGVYDSDPEKNPHAKKFDTLTFDEVISLRLKVMDMTAFTLCQENALPIAVLNIEQKGNLKKFLMGEKIGTIIK